MAHFIKQQFGKIPKVAGKKLLDHWRKRLTEVYRIASMQDASFGTPKETEKIVEATRLFRESWIRHPIDEIISEMEAILDHPGENTNVLS
jgi:hypothetical protein